MKNKNFYFIDLTQRPPRSARVQLGGYATLARCLDKGRATIAGKNGEYHFDCPLDQNVLTFAGIKAAALKKQLALGKSDTEIVEWIAKVSTTKHTPMEIALWSEFAARRGPNDFETREHFNGMLAKISKTREDILTWFDMLDADDYVTFGGQA